MPEKKVIPTEFDVNINRLDEESEKQARLMRNACLDTAELKKLAAVAKAEHKYQEGRLMLDIYQNFAAHGFEKSPPEHILRAKLVTLPDYIKTQDAWIDAELAYDRSRADVEGYEHKKTSIEGLIKLHGQGYFSKPSMTSDDRKAVEGANRERTMDEAAPKEEEARPRRRR